MIVYLNGQFVPEDCAVVSVFDRGLLYGDGLFETMRICSAKPFQWDQHLERLLRGAQFLRINLPVKSAELYGAAEELIRQNGLSEATLRMQISRGPGPRGYSPKGADHPWIAMTLHPAPTTESQSLPQWRLVTSSLRVASNDPLARFKSCNRLIHVLARAEAEEKNADESLLLNADGVAVEATNSNLFWVADDEVFTTPISAGALPGITRALVIDLCAGLSISCHEKPVHVEELKMADALFLTLSTHGIVLVSRLDDKLFSPHPLVEKLSRAYRKVLQTQCQIPT